MLTADLLVDRVMGVLTPVPVMTISEWADARRRLSPEASAMPGPWRTGIVEFMREPMDCIGDATVRRVVIMAGSQVAKTEVLLNTVGFLIDYDPSPILVVQPNLDMAKAFSKDRIAPMIRDTPCLKGRVRDPRSRDANNTLFQKSFPGGHITMIGANSAAGLASRPIRAVLFDEVDRFPPSAGTEGDPISLAIKRTTTFWNRVIVMVSTPTIKDHSRIEAAYQEGDQRQRWCPCPDCGEYQVLVWRNVRWESGKPHTAHYMCEHCGSVWSDAMRTAAVRAGEWRAQEPFEGVASFHVSGLMSPFIALEDAVREFLESQRNPERLKTWTNTFLGETWEEQGERLDGHSLMQQREEYEAHVPAGVTVLVAGVDVQDDRVEVETVGFGDDSESWSIDHTVLHGDPSAPQIWIELDKYLRQSFDHPLFGEMAISRACVDSGGHYTQQVYRFVGPRMPLVLAVKGMGGQGKPLIGRPSKNNIGKIPLFPVGVHTAKELVYARLRAKEGDAGYCHFPAHYDQEYFDQLTAESLVTRYHRGFKVQEFTKIRARNEALDLRVYATAALTSLNIDLNARRRGLERRKLQDQQEADTNEQAQARKRPKKRPNFVNSWRG